MQFRNSMLTALAASLVVAAPAPSFEFDKTSTISTASKYARQALGSAIVVNECSFTIYVRVAANTGPNGSPVTGPLQTLNPGDAYDLTFETPATGGVDYRVATSDPSTTSDILNFEYTVDQGSGEVFYDVSTVQGNPFQANGYALDPTDNTCTAIVCGAGATNCDQGTHTCRDTANLQLNVCP